MYARISEDREGAGLGVERQLGDQCALFAQLGLRLTGVYADNDLSAFTGKPRPDYLAMLTDLDSGGAKVVTAWHTDRLHRTPKGTVALRRRASLHAPQRERTPFTDRTEP